MNRAYNELEAAANQLNIQTLGVPGRLTRVIGIVLLDGAAQQNIAFTAVKYQQQQ